MTVLAVSAAHLGTVVEYELNNAIPLWAESLEE